MFQIRGIDVKKPPLVADRGQTRGGFLLNGQIPKMIIKKSAKNMIFELFRTFKVPKKFRPSAEKNLGTNKGGFLIKGGFLNINTPDCGRAPKGYEFLKI